MAQYSALEQKDHFGFVDTHPNLKGIISVDKLTHKGILDEEHLIISVITEDGTVVDDEAVCRIMEFPATIIGACSADTAALINMRAAGIQAQKDEIAERNKQYFQAECDKLDAYTEDLKDGLQKFLKTIKKQIDDKKKEARALKDTGTLEDVVAVQKEIFELESKRTKKQRELYDEEDRLERERDALLEEVRERLAGEIETQTIMTFSFEIV